MVRSGSGVVDLEERCTRVMAVGAVILSRERVLLVYNRRPGGGGHWSLPKGMCAEGEPLVATLQREVREETGLEAEPLGLAFVTEFLVEPRREWYLQFYFNARVTAGRAQVQPDDPDVTRVRWVPVADLPQFLTYRPWLEPLQGWLQERKGRYYMFT